MICDYIMQARTDVPAQRTFTTSIFPGESLDRLDAQEHPLPSRRVCRVQVDDRGDKATKGNGFLDPSDNIVSGATSIIAEIVIEAQLRHAAIFQEADRLVWPPHTNPSWRRFALVIQENFHPATIS